MTDMLVSSKFTWLTQPGATENARPNHDIVIAESKNFAVLPSLGSLVPGWVLVVPKRPMTRFADLHIDERAEFVSLRDRVLNILGRFPGNLYMFEHGGTYGSSVSCSVDQAHLHIVPLHFNLVSAALNEQEQSWIDALPIEEIDASQIIGSEYLFVSDGIRNFKSYPELPTSQWFRKLIAANIGRPDQWDYKRYPNADVVAVTACAFGS